MTEANPNIKEDWNQCSLNCADCWRLFKLLYSAEFNPDDYEGDEPA